MLQNVVTSSSIAVSLLPEELLTRLEEENVEAEMCSTALLIAQVVLGALDALKTGELKKLDANPGNGSCQQIALEIWRVSLLDLRDEIDPLYRKVKSLKELVQKRKSSPTERKKIESKLFFKNCVLPLKVSRVVEFLIHSPFLMRDKSAL